MGEKWFYNIIILATTIYKLSTIAILYLFKFCRELINGFIKFIAVAIWEWFQIAFFCVFVAYFIAGFLGFKL